MALSLVKTSLNGISGTSDLPFDIFYAHFLACFFVVVKPFSFGQVDGSEFCA